MSHYLQQHTKQKYNTLYQRIAKAIQSGKFITYTKAKRKALQERLHRYERRLKNWGIAVASVAALFGAPIAANGQITFTQQTGLNNPLGSPNNPFDGIDVFVQNTPTFADLDGDGDFDVFIGEFYGTVKYFQNTGSSSSPSFLEQTGTSNPFDGIDVGIDSAPTFADLDGDGDLDAFIGERYGTVKYFQNTGSNSNPAFAEQTGTSNPFDGIYVSGNSAPTFADLDGDGDFDAFIGDFFGTIKYYQNTGSNSNPIFVEQTGTSNPFDGVRVDFFSTPTFVDLDGDGDLDAFIGGRLSAKYYQNTGSSSNPIFVLQTGSNDPLDGIDIGFKPVPVFVDIDSDGDFDAFIGNGFGNVNYFQNTGSSSNPIFVSQNPGDVGEYSAPTLVDIDGDGDLDAFVGESNSTVKYFQNTGSSSSPAFVAQTGANNPLDGIDVGTYSTPTFVDIDGDGDLDAFIGERLGAIKYYQNIGSSSNPIFVSQNRADVGEYSAPTLVDIDGDGDFDAFIGERNSRTIKYFQNIGSNSSPAFVEQTGANNPLDGIDVSDFSAPTFVDIDSDGDFDAFVGEIDGIVRYFQNTGSSSSPAFVAQTGSNNPLDGIDVRYFSKPTFVDIDGDGDFDAFIGEIDGTILYYQNTGSSSSPIFTAQTGASNPLDGVDVGKDSAPAFVDIDGDGDFDAFIGEEDRNINYFQNIGSSNSPTFVAQTGSNNPFDNLSVSENSTPTFADIDGDGDFDAFIGGDTGTFLYFQNTGSASSPTFVLQIEASNPLDAIDVGRYSVPTFVDIDGDGDFDAFIGEYYGTILYYQNTGSTTSPAFVAQTGSNNPLDGVDVSYDGAPAFVDIDGDGDFDAFIGEYYGTILYYQNTGSTSSPAFVEQTGADNPFDGVKSDYNSKPTFADIDGDGDFDAFIGEDSGNIRYFRNDSPPRCIAEAGELGNSEDIATIELCEGTDSGVLFEQTGASANDEYAFLLVNENGGIVANTTDGDFDLAALSVGTYTVYGLSYASNNSPAALADYLADKTSINDIETDDADTNFCLELSNTATTGETNLITVKANPIVSQQPSDQAICEGETATFEVTASGDDLSYQWQQDGIDLSNENDASLNADQTGDYNVLITQNGCIISSDTVSLTLDPSCDIPDISTLEVSYCEKELSADFKPVPGAVGYRAEVTVLGRNGEVITRNIPTPPFDLKISVPERLLGTTIQVRLAAIFIDAETQQRVVGTFSESRNIVIMNCGTRNSDDLESRGSITTALSHALLSPNPASEILNLSYASPSSSQVQIMLVDATGRMVWQTKQTSSEGNNQLEIPVADLPAGMYQLRLVIAEEVAILPFVKQ